MKSPEEEYQRLLESFEFDPGGLDYALLERHKSSLAQLARMSNCGVTVYDMYQRKHVFTSGNFAHLFGYDLNEVEKYDADYFGRQIHPDDLPVIARNGVAVLRHFLEKREGWADSKMISEYRILAGERYLRVIEQYQVLEFDAAGNVWLSLSVLDVSPDQGPLEAVRCKLMNCITGELYQLPEFSEPYAVSPLSEREKRILQLVRDGHLSKEISEQLAISVHTVNTHRQRILEKLNVDNSHEAVRYASRYGLLD